MRKRKYTCKKVTTISEFVDAIRIRAEVFIIEQKCPPGWEPDEMDKVAGRFVAIADTGAIVATARLCKEATGALKLERMAVKKEYRGQGAGQALTDYIVSEALKG